MISVTVKLDASLYFSSSPSIGVRAGGVLPCMTRSTSSTLTMSFTMSRTTTNVSSVPVAARPNWLLAEMLTTASSPATNSVTVGHSPSLRTLSQLLVRIPSTVR